MKIVVSFLIFSFLFLNVLCQPKNKNDSIATKKIVDSINRLIDNAIVNKQYDILQKHYAQDFYFKHGAGQIDNKESWIEYQRKPTTNYVSRSHDSVSVELHKDIAVLKGILSVNRLSDGKKSAYSLKYFRVYIYRKKVWQLLSHNTIEESH
jgi:exopolysaccharide biosynthesis protein